jgi:hypothetical protein
MSDLLLLELLAAVSRIRLATSENGGIFEERPVGVKPSRAVIAGGSQGSGSHPSERRSADTAAGETRKLQQLRIFIVLPSNYNESREFIANFR